MAEDTKQLDELKNLWSQFVKTNETALGETKVRSVELNETMKKMADRMDELETKLARPRFGDPSNKGEKSAQEKAFDNYFRKGVVGPEMLKVEFKADAVTDTDPSGGYLVPDVISQRIIERLVLISPFRDLAAVETISTGDALEVPVENAFVNVGWTGERVAPPAVTNASTFNYERVPAHEQYARPRASQKMLDDSAFDVEAWINRKIQQIMGQDEGKQFLQGSGVQQPEGLVTLAAKAGSSISNTLSGVLGAVAVDTLFDLIASLPTIYANGATIIGNRKTKFAIRKLKDTTNRYLWEPSLQVGEPPNFDGIPFKEMPDLDDLATGKFSLFVGNFKEAYTIVDRKGIYLLRDPYSSKPFIEFYTRRRVGGQVTKPEAVKAYKIT